MVVVVLGAHKLLVPLVLAVWVLQVKIILGFQVLWWCSRVKVSRGLTQRILFKSQRTSYEFLHIRRLSHSMRFHNLPILVS